MCTHKRQAFQQIFIFADIFSDYHLPAVRQVENRISAFSLNANDLMQVHVLDGMVVGRQGNPVRSLLQTTQMQGVKQQFVAFESLAILVALAGLIEIVFQHLPAFDPGTILLALLVIYLLWRNLGEWLQNWFTTRPASLKQLQSGIKAGKELMQKYQGLQALVGVPAAS